MKCFHSPQKQITPVMARSRVYDCGITLLHTVGVCSLTSVWSGTLLTSLSTSIVVAGYVGVSRSQRYQVNLCHSRVCFCFDSKCDFVVNVQNKT